MKNNNETILSLHNVSKHFGGLKAVSNVSINVAYSERRLFIGTNGAGKTTLFNLIAGDLKVTNGQIMVFGKDVTQMPVPKRVRLGMRRTYQTSALLDGLTVKENLYIALLGNETSIKHLNILHSMEKNKKYYELAYKTACNIQLENKFDVKVNELSHGERRQLEFGLAIITKPKLLMFDEPCAGLSQEERQTMLKLIKSLDRSVTIILIEHDMEIAFSIADYITVMHEGKLLVEGTPEEIKNNNTVNQIYLGGRAND